MASIKNVNGAMRMVVDGKVLPLFLYRNRLHTEYDYIKRFVDDGHRLIVCTILQDPDDPWDVHRARVESHLNRVLDLGKDHYLIFGHYFVVSREWAQQHRDHMCQDEKGRLLDLHPPQRGFRQEGMRYALVSPLVREQMREYTRQHVEIVRSLPRKDRIIGMLFEGGGAQEWYCYRMDPRWVFAEGAPVYIAEFRKFLKRKYKSEVALRQAWQQPRVTFKSAEPPSPEQSAASPGLVKGKAGEILAIGDFYSPQIRQSYVDAHEFFVEFHSEAVLTGPKEMKRLAPNLLAGFFNEPIIDDPMSLYEGNLPVRESSCVDFFAGPPPYECRSPKDAQPLHTFTGGLRVRRKAFIAEEDQRPPARNDAIQVWAGDTHSVEDFCHILLRQGVQDITAGCHGWWWDFQWQWYQHPRMHETFRRLLWLDEWNLSHKGKPCAQIAVIWDRQSAPYMTSNGRISKNLGHRQMIQELDRSGAPWDGYCTDDLLQPGFPRRQYKLFIVAFAAAPDAAARKAMDSLKRDGATILWSWGAGFANPSSRKRPLSVRNMHALTGLRFRVHDHRCCPTVYVADGMHPLQRALPDGYAFGQCARQLLSGRLASPERPLFPPVTSCAPLFAVDDPEATILGYTGAEYAGDIVEAGHPKANAAPLASVELHPGLAVRDFGTWTSIYAGTTLLPGRFIREVARLARVHIYNETEDLFFANSRMMGLTASYKTGPRTIRLPRQCDVLDLLTPKPTVIARRTREVTIDVQRYRTAIMGLV